MPAAVAGQVKFSLRPASLIADLDQLFTQTDVLFARAQYRTSFNVANTCFSVSSDLQHYLAAASTAIASAGSCTAASARIFVGVAGEGHCPAITWGARHFEERRIDGLLSPSRYRMYHYQPLSYWQIYDKESATGLQILQGADEYPPWDLGSPLRNFLQWRLASTGGSLVHAGTLGIGDKGVLLAGAGGSGKSGTVLSGICEGLSSVGDDYVFVNPDRMEAYALFETLKQDSAGLRRLNLSAHPAIPAEVNWQNKFQFYMSDLECVERPAALSLHAVLLPTITGASRTTFIPISAKDAFLALAPSAVTQIPGDRPLIYATAASISRRLPCHRLCLGTDPQEVSGAIRQFIQGL